MAGRVAGGIEHVVPTRRGVFDHEQDRAAAIGEDHVTWTGKQLGDGYPGVRCAGVLTGIARGEGEQVAHLAAGHVDDAHALTLAQQKGTPVTAGNPQGLDHADSTRRVRWLAVWHDCPSCGRRPQYAWLIDALEDRQADSLAQWLRDRSGALCAYLR